MREKTCSKLFLPILITIIVLFGTQKGRTASFYFHAYDSNVSITWDPYTDGTATGFKLYYKVVDWNKTCGPPYDGTGLNEGDSPILYVISVDIDPLNVLIHLSGATKGKKYCFVSTAYNSQAESEYSNEDYKTFWEEWIAIAWENNSQVCPPADYDGDGKDDFAVKTYGGYYIIDMSNDHHNGYWNLILPSYGGYSAHPAPADYDGDGMADISVKTDDGRWLIDYASDGFGSWDEQLNDYGGSGAIPIPGDYDGDGSDDISVKVDDGRRLIDYADDGFGSWDDSFSGYGGGLSSKK